jgi:hypothetical protein
MNRNQMTQKKNLKAEEFKKFIIKVDCAREGAFQLLTVTKTR